MNPLQFEPEKAALVIVSNPQIQLPLFDEVVGMLTTFVANRQLDLL